MLTSFWERVDVGGRDKNDASFFKSGEEVYPMGPPRASYIIDSLVDPQLCANRKSEAQESDARSAERRTNCIHVS
jgi:hypothetical protein